MFCLANALRGLGFPAFVARINQRHDIFNAPQTVGNASGHRRRDLQSFVDADEIIIEKTQRQRMTAREFTSAGRFWPLGPVGIFAFKQFGLPLCHQLKDVLSVEVGHPRSPNPTEG